jgi:hypothetical protein
MGRWLSFDNALKAMADETKAGRECLDNWVTERSIPSYIDERGRRLVWLEDEAGLQHRRERDRWASIVAELSAQVSDMRRGLEALRADLHSGPHISESGLHLSEVVVPQSFARRLASEAVERPALPEDSLPIARPCAPMGEPRIASESVLGAANERLRRPLERCASTTSGELRPIRSADDDAAHDRVDPAEALETKQTDAPPRPIRASELIAAMLAEAAAEPTATRVDGPDSEGPERKQSQWVLDAIRAAREGDWAGDTDETDARARPDLTHKSPARAGGSSASTATTNRGQGTPLPPRPGSGQWGRRLKPSRQRLNRAAWSEGSLKTWLASDPGGHAESWAKGPVRNAPDERERAPEIRPEPPRRKDSPAFRFGDFGSLG